MSPENSKSHLSRQGIWGFVILGAALVVMAAIATLPYVWLAVSEPAYAETRTELRFLQGKLKNSKTVQQAGLTAADNIDPLFVAGDTPGLATAGLQSIVAQIAGENGMVVERTQPLQTDNTDGAGILRMEVEASGSIENLRGYLLALESNMPLIFVNQAKVSPSQSTDNIESLPSDRLTVSLQLEAYGWWEAKSQ